MDNRELINELLDTPIDDLTTDHIFKVVNEKTAIPIWQPIVLPANHPVNTTRKELSTTLGRYLFNALVLQQDLVDLLGYQNDVFTASKIKKFEKNITRLVIEDRIPAERMAVYIDRLFWLFTLSPVFAPSISYGMMTPKEAVIKRRDELFAQYADEIAAGDIATAAKIEKELTEMARIYIDDEDAGAMLLSIGLKKPSMDQIKECTIMRGAIASQRHEGGFLISRASLAEGIPWNEYPEYVNVAVTGIFKRSVATAVGGYTAKQIASALQALTFVNDSDCKTPYTLRVRIENDSDFYLRYIVDNDKLVLLDNETIQKYIGSYVQLRSPMYCRHGDNTVCEVCSGTYFKQLGIASPSATANRIGTQLMQISMKAFHNSSIKTTTIKDFNKFLSPRR
jgi:hypothetical protein